MAGDQRGYVDRFHKIAQRNLLHGVLDNVFLSVTRQKKERYGRMLAQGMSQFETRFPGHTHVEHSDIGPFDGHDALRLIGTGAALNRIARLLQAFAQCRQDQPVVVDQQGLSAACRVRFLSFTA